MIIVVLGSVVSELWRRRLMEMMTPLDAVQYDDQIQVTQSEMLFGRSKEGPSVIVVGTIENQSDVAWEQIGMEAQFYDPDGKLIDVEVESHYLEQILPYGEMAFKLKTVAELSVDRYASYKVYVRSASDASEWP